MCGISGLIAFLPFQSDLLRAMTGIISHRGPDDEGYVLFGEDLRTPMARAGKDTAPTVFDRGLPYAPAERSDRKDGGFLMGLGHRRLSIIDVSAAGHQPMCTADRRFWIVYNGEVYNYLELRQELRAKGHRFLTQSDTEVILAAFREWGRDCLDRFNGMFAFLLYDAQKTRLFAARDRFGIKPLYYRVSKCGIAFASEIKQFTVLPDWRAGGNGQRLYDFLNWGVSDHTHETMFSGVFQLRGGEALDLDLAALPPTAPEGHLPVYRWYRLQGKPFSGSLQEAAAEFRSLFTDAVRLYLRADVPVGSCLSGGLDSSSIVCVMNDILRSQNAQALQKTFSACAEAKRFDERQWIEKVVRQTGVEAHYVYPSLDELFATHERILWHQDEPFGSTSIYAQWQVFGLAAANGVKVMLDGQGADEQLAGYHTFFGPRFAGLCKHGRWLTLWQEIKLGKRLHGYSELEALKRMADMLLPEGIRHRLRGVAGRTGAQPNWLAMDRLGAVPRDPFIATGFKADTVSAMSKSMLVASNLQMLLHWEDRDSMAHSIESRVPFLDHRLVEFVLGLPDEYKLAAGITKRVLREGLRGLLPEGIRTRLDKLGFATPEEIWVRERMPEVFRQKVREAIEQSSGILQPEAMRILEEMIAGQRPFNFLPWRLISFAAWLRRFGVDLAGAA